MKPWTGWLALGMLVGLGCGEAPNSSSYKSNMTATRGASPAPAFEADYATGEALPAESPADKFDEAAQVETAPPKEVPRKIIYTADVDLTVLDFPKAEQGIARLVKESGGYLADSNLSGAPGEQRSGTWKVRIPTERFESFIASVIALGELQRRSTNSQDVTEEFFDLEARIKNKQVEEGRLVKHLEESTGKLKEILDVEKEISRVRGEIERFEGRRKLLANLTSLTTVTINVREVREYVPATSPTFAALITRRFQSSIDQLTWFLKGVILTLVSIVPWLPIWALVLGVLWLVRRWVRPWFRPRSLLRPRQTPGG
ncbi:MAG: DUF4349 domain-containing protein [Isosphaeraceae bacterium]